MNWLSRVLYTVWQPVVQSKVQPYRLDVSTYSNKVKRLNYKKKVEIAKGFRLLCLRAK